MSSFDQHTTGREVVAKYRERIDGKTIVITGPSYGSIGGETVLSLAEAKAKAIFLCGRNQQRITPVMEAFATENCDTKLIFVQMNLNDLDSVRAAASSIASQTERVDVLFNNAGVMTTPYGTTKQGIESQFGINHIAHFVLTACLLPLLRAAGPGAAIVNTASTGYQLGGIPFEDLTWDNGAKYHPWLAYASSKTANSLFTVSLAAKLKANGIKAFALQPGMPSTNLASHLPTDGLASIAEAVRINTERFGGVEQDMSGDTKTLAESCSTLLAAAFDPNLEGNSGSFLRNCAPYEVLPYAQDPQDADRLWRISEELAGQQFDT